MFKYFCKNELEIKHLCLIKENNNIFKNKRLGNYHFGLWMWKSVTI